MELQGLVDHKDLKAVSVLSVQVAYLAMQVRQETWDQREVRVLLGLKVCKEAQVLLEHQESTVTQDLQDHREPLVLQVLPDYLAQQVLQETMVLQVK